MSNPASKTTAKTTAALGTALRARQRQWEAFAQWERQQAQGEAATPKSPAELRDALAWYADALKLARRLQVKGGPLPEFHLEQLIDWVRRRDQIWKQS